MNTTHQPKINSIGVLTIILGTCILITGCSSTGKNKKSQLAHQSTQQAVAQPIVNTQLASPSLTYILNTAEINDNRSVTAEQWLSMAESNYQSKRYARALRAANEALKINSRMEEARQLAMLSAVKVAESNVSAYNNKTLMNDKDKAELRDTLADITSLINTP